MSRANRRHHHRRLSLLRGRTASRLRRALAATLLLAAALLTFLDGSADAPTGSPTVVAARELPSGSRVDRADVRVVRYPERIRPQGAFEDPGDVVGHVLSGAAGRGEPLTPTRLIGETSAAPATTTVPIRLADPGIARLLEPGTKVDVVTVAASGETGRVLATAATVLTVTTKSPAGGHDDAPLVLLAVADDAATELAATALNQPVTVTLG